MRGYLLSTGSDVQTEVRAVRRLIAHLREASFAFWTASGRIEAWSSEASTLLGYDALEASTLSVETLLGTGGILGADSADAPRPMTLRTKDGRGRLVTVSFSPFAEDAREGVLMMAIMRPSMDPDREGLFGQVFEHAASGIAVAHLSGKILECNPAFQRLVGFSERELRHLTLEALGHWSDRGQEGPIFRELASGGRDSYEITKRLVRKDGRVLWVQSTVSLVRDEAGEPRTCIALFNDITEQRQAAQRSAIQLTLTKILADNPPVNTAVMLITQAICKTLDWQIGEYWTLDPLENALRRQASWQVPGFNAADFNQSSHRLAVPIGEGIPGTVWLTGKPAWISDVVRDQNFLRRREAQRAGLKGAFGFPVQTASETLGIMFFTSQDFREPDNFLLAMMEDFGAQIGQFIVRKQAERHLKLLGSIVQSSHDAIVGISLDGIITTWNPSAEKLFGYASAEAIGMACEDLFPEEVSDALLRALDRIRSGEPTPRIETLTRGKLGTTHEVWVTHAPVEDEHGRLAGASLTIRDLCDR